MDELTEAKRIFDIEIEALRKTRDILDNTFVQILNLITGCKGKVIVTGMGKPGHIATKIAATFSSLGTSSFFLHPAEAMHGDLGMISKDDVVIAISYSGESDEIVRILPEIKLIGAKLISITGNSKSTLATKSDVVQILPQFKEACYLGLAPTSSTTVELCYGDALAVVASAIYGFKDAEFGRYHPAGALGKRLTYKVSDLMDFGEENAVVTISASLKEAIMELSKKGLGIVSVVDDNGRLRGVITEGDIRRILLREMDVYNMTVSEVMNFYPKTISDDKLAYEALGIMKDNGISCLPVLDKNKIVGTVRMRKIIEEGVI